MTSSAVVFFPFRVPEVSLGFVFKMAASMEEEDSDFGPSELGCKYYWDKFYEEELKNFADYGDHGEVWFGELTMKKVLDWLCQSSDVKKESKILDIGCGNGVMLNHLSKLGFTDLKGIDYSPLAISLAEKISAVENVKISYEEVDIADLEKLKTTETYNQRFDVILDKGTYDAISLSPFDSTQERQSYLINVKSLLADDGMYVLTSCNWTRDELLQFFTKELTFKENIEMPTFKFGGIVGQTVTSLVFTKKPLTQGMFNI